MISVVITLSCLDIPARLTLRPVSLSFILLFLSSISKNRALYICYEPFTRGFLHATRRVLPPDDEGGGAYYIFFYSPLASIYNRMGYDRLSTLLSFTFTILPRRITWLLPVIVCSPGLFSLDPGQVIRLFTA